MDIDAYPTPLHPNLRRVGVFLSSVLAYREWSEIARRDAQSGAFTHPKMPLTFDSRDTLGSLPSINCRATSRLA